MNLFPRRRAAAVKNRLPRQLNGFQLVVCTDGIARLAPVVLTDRNLPSRSK